MPESDIPALEPRAADLPAWDGAMAARYVYIPAWRRQPPRDQQELLMAWAAAQPREPDPIEIVAAAVRDGVVRGAMIGKVSQIDFVKRPMVVCACRLAEGEADEGLGYELVRYGLELLDVWARRENPVAEGALLATAPDRFAALRSRPVWPDAGLMLSRIETDGRHIRLRWFHHARF